MINCLALLFVSLTAPPQLQSFAVAAHVGSPVAFAFSVEDQKVLASSINMDGVARIMVSNTGMATEFGFSSKDTVWLSAAAAHRYNGSGLTYAGYTQSVRVGDFYVCAWHVRHVLGESVLPPERKRVRSASVTKSGKVVVLFSDITGDAVAVLVDKKWIRTSLPKGKSYDAIACGNEEGEYYFLTSAVSAGLVVEKVMLFRSQKGEFEEIAQAARPYVNPPSLQTHAATTQSIASFADGLAVVWIRNGSLVLISKANGKWSTREVRS